ncbi:MAG: archease [Candidatus Omnitrophica bacterium]|nr:archease [Candidatus Omnitrophota bacterium]MBI3009520.1 archease [Candidatus Omnitrophota bacterium]
MLQCSNLKGNNGMSYEFFDHTADIGIQAQGSSLAELLMAMACGLRELVAEDSLIQPQEQRAIKLAAEDPASLLRVWLQELLFWFSTDRFLPAKYELSNVTATTVEGRVQGERFDPMRHVPGREVKAITRHQLEVKQQAGKWFGRVIVDI